MNFCRQGMRPSTETHQYIERETRRIKTEKLFADRVINSIYSDVREKSPLLFKMLTSARFTQLMGWMNYDLPWGSSVTGARKLVEKLGVDLSECLDPVGVLETPRKLFERKIRYWAVRPMPAEMNSVVSPADSKMIVGSFAETSQLFLKEKFFGYNELLGRDRCQWLSCFHKGDFAVFRLTPEKYHHNHTPIAGRVVDFYEIAGDCHSCNPGALIQMVSAYSKNKRVVTVFDTDVEGGSRVGLVAMVEVVALMIGGVVQCYSENGYEDPKPVYKGLAVKKGCPKSLYRPGSSVDILIFQKNRIAFSDDILLNLRHPGATSRYSLGFGKPLVETEVKVRSAIAAGKRN